ncbi:MAG: hypothetical protein H6727_18340 [Myxococcales bacterium]|nr:hypothetical protein [Myxococcales bacterium]
MHVHSPTGMGQLFLSRKKQHWPRHIALHFRLGSLEGFHIFGEKIHLRGIIGVEMESITVTLRKRS